MQSQDVNEGFALTPNFHHTSELQSFLFFFTTPLCKMLCLKELGGASALPVGPPHLYLQPFPTAPPHILGNLCELRVDPRPPRSLDVQKNTLGGLGAAPARQDLLRAPEMQTKPFLKLHSRCKHLSWLPGKEHSSCPEVFTPLAPVLTLNIPFPR